MDKVLKHKQIENQLLEAKLAQQTLILNEEREQALKEKQLLLQESLEYQKKCEQLVKDEAELKLQVSIPGGHIPGGQNIGWGGGGLRSPTMTPFCSLYIQPSVAGNLTSFNLFALNVMQYIA